MIELPDKKKCYNLPEQVAQNLRNITFLAEQYKNIDALPVIWQTYKEEFDRELETFGEWTTTFEGWDTTLSTYLANMSSAAVGAIAGQNIAPANVAATGAITANSITENMPDGYYNYLAGTNDASQVTLTPLFAGAVKNGNKLTLCFYGKIKRLDTISVGGAMVHLMTLDNLPTDVLDKLIPAQDNRLEMKQIYLATDYANGTTLPGVIAKSGNALIFRLYSANNLTLNTEYLFRFESTFLLCDNLVP